MAIFEASPEGFRSQNIARPAAHLVRELIQNAFDEGAPRIDVEVSHSPVRGVRVFVKDNVPGGFRDESLIFTIWKSDKADVPTKRGRMGRGLKEIVSVADRTTVRTQGRAGTVFKRDKATTAWTRSTLSSETCDIGSEVEAYVTAWSKMNVRAIETYLARVRPPIGTQLFVNGVEVVRQQETERREVRMTTVIYGVDEGGERKELHPRPATFIDLFPPRAGEKPWVYEMGLPIEEIEYPLSIDIGQRVPLREQRDTLVGFFRSELFGTLLNARLYSLPPEALRDSHVLLGVASWVVSDDVKKRIADVWTENRPYATTPQQLSQATGQHIEVCDLRKLPEGIRDVVKAKGKPVTEVFEAMRSTHCPEVDDTERTADEAQLVAKWERICEGIYRPTLIRICAGKPFNCQADFEPSTQTLTLYREVLGEAFFSDPYAPQTLSTLIHELAHWKLREDNHGKDFHSDSENVGGLVASFLVKNGG